MSFPEIEKFDKIPEAKTAGCTAFLSVMEGCSKYCSYCVVPYTRGEEISRPFDDVIAEAHRLAELGVREINAARPERERVPRRGARRRHAADLATLIYFVAGLEGVDRIRFTTSHPNEFTDSLVDAYANVDKLVSYLHLPVQSGSDRVLQLMKRGYTAAEFVERIDKVKRARPGISIATDLHRRLSRARPRKTSSRRSSSSARWASISRIQLHL